MIERINKEIFYQLISSELTKNPEWLEIAIRAISDGMEGAMQKLNENVRKKDAAFLAALALIKNERLSKEAVSYLNSLIIEKIKEEQHPCKLEKDFIKNE
jgi:hypothetical protein